MSIGLTLKHPHFVQRGDVIVHDNKEINGPALSYDFQSHLFWLGEKPLREGKIYKVKINTNEFKVQVAKVHYAVDPDGSQEIQSDIEKFYMGKVTFTSPKLLPSIHFLTTQ